MTQPRTVFIIAGEASGDMLGGRLIEALRDLSAVPLRLVGVGGDRMRAAGFEALFDQKELAHMGLVEVLRHLPSLWRRLRQTVAAARALRPAALVTIDAPDFSFRVARRLRGLGFPLIHYVAPTVWAWRPGRAKKVAGFLDHLLALLPFEPPYFTREGLACDFVGHPVVEDRAVADGDAWRTRHGVGASAIVLTVLLGSRTGEVTRLAPIFGTTLARLRGLYPDLVVAVPTVPQVEEEVRRLTVGWSGRVLITTSDTDKRDAWATSRAALACSGTVALELALAGLPAVIAYRVNPLTAWIARRLIKTPYVNLVNILHERAVVPELIQQDCSSERLAAALTPLLSDEAARAVQIAALRQVAGWLGAAGEAPSRRAARIVLQRAKIPVRA